ncbi:MAG: hypothetical protein O8C64_00340 [Candidatus Methanoperedens sp.]|nr:hypothetical protein [Candidatus Methanoperedens sp.]MCZ7405622.1 hypothetical protein [Candidatus Methanoperedens sp.]
MKSRTADSESRLGRAQTRMPAGIRGFPLPKGNRDADERRFAASAFSASLKRILRSRRALVPNPQGGVLGAAQGWARME